MLFLIELRSIGCFDHVDFGVIALTEYMESQQKFRGAIKVNTRVSDSEGSHHWINAFIMHTHAVQIIQIVTLVRVRMLARNMHNNYIIVSGIDLAGEGRGMCCKTSSRGAYGHTRF